MSWNVKLTEFRCTRIDRFPRNSMRQSLWSSCAFKATLSSIYDVIDFIAVWETDTAWIGLNTHIPTAKFGAWIVYICMKNFSTWRASCTCSCQERARFSHVKYRANVSPPLPAPWLACKHFHPLQNAKRHLGNRGRESKDWEKQQRSSGQTLSCAQWFIFLDNEKVNRLTELPNMAHCVSGRQSDLELATLQSLIWT